MKRTGTSCCLLLRRKEEGRVSIAGGGRRLALPINSYSFSHHSSVFLADNNRFWPGGVSRLLKISSTSYMEVQQQEQRHQTSMGKKRGRTLVGTLDPHLAECQLEESDLASFAYVVSVEAADTTDFLSCTVRPSIH